MARILVKEILRLFELIDCGLELRTDQLTVWVRSDFVVVQDSVLVLHSRQACVSICRCLLFLVTEEVHHVVDNFVLGILVFENFADFCLT